MGRTEIVEKAILRFPIAGVSKKVIHAIADALFHSIILTLQITSHIEIRGFGSFTVVERKARQGRNPKTGEPVAIPARKEIKFKPGKVFRAALQGE